MKQEAARLALAVAAKRSPEELRLLAVAPRAPADSKSAPLPGFAASLQSARQNNSLARPSAEKSLLSCLFRKLRTRHPPPAPLANFYARWRPARPIHSDPCRLEDCLFDQTLSNARAAHHFDKRAGLYHRESRQILRRYLLSPQIEYPAHPMPRPKCISFSDRRRRFFGRPA